MYMNAKANNLIYMLIAFNVICVNVFAQDVHFSHIHANLIQLNPAMVGDFDGKLRFAADAKRSYRTVTADYKTLSASVDGILKEKKNSSFAGGMRLFADQAGDLKYGMQAVYGNLSYSMLAGEKIVSKLSFGMEGGVFRHGFKTSEVRAYDEEPLFADEKFQNARLVADFSVGGNLTIFNRTKQNPVFSSAFLGMSLHHITSPEYSFLGAASGYAENLYQKLNLVGGTKLNFKNQTSLLVYGQWLKQGPHRELYLGANYNFANIEAANNVAAISGGVYGRLWHHRESSEFGMDAISAILRVDFANTIYAISYDINVSTLDRASRGQNGIEISVIHIVRWSEKDLKKRQFFCPVY